MTLLDLFARDAAGPLDLTSAPSDAGAAHIRLRAQQLVNLEAAVDRAEDLLKAMKKRRETLAMRLLPDLMDQAQTDTIGLPEAGVDVVVQPYVFAAIKEGLSDEERAAAFAHLEALGGGDLVQAVLSVRFAKEDLPRAQRAQEAIATYLKKLFPEPDATPPAVELKLSVHWGTLTSWLKRTLETREAKLADGAVVWDPDGIEPRPNVLTVPPLHPALLGATVGRVCKVVERKVAKRKARGK